MIWCPTRQAADNHTYYTGKCSLLNLHVFLEDRTNSFSLQVQGLYQGDDLPRRTDPTNKRQISSTALILGTRNIT